ncbi:hypothetical protein GCM10011386_40950 [Parapedobacter defluvii]|uniref:DUF2752 domain-containing protein n=1 Tax=Parapedobacter defluvii TaxID=2045106 RepID=A0ABQ1MPU1_9SPHI|nr:DUF2752 domain-containing protein [Parapedobacter defluvii]GGC44426.1 hypothetical protein GCM10011386_40950 [Parapedobacter defluvii]
MAIKTIRKTQRYNLPSTQFFAGAVCSLEASSWLQNFLLPCPFKALTGIDCPGCGFQRSLLALLKGNWGESYHLYPPTVPLLIVLLYALVKWIGGFDKRDVVLKILAVACGWFVIGVYVVKLWNGHG